MTQVAGSDRPPTPASGPHPDRRLGDEQLTIQRSLRELAQRRIAPRAAAIDQAEAFPWDVVQLLREHDAFAIGFPAAVGGLSGSALSLIVAIEEVARACATSSLLLAVQALGGAPILLAGTAAQRQRLLPDLASGRRLAAYALSEADAGSDPKAMRTRAVRDGRDYILDGAKMWITNGEVAELIVVFAVTDPAPGASGISAFVVEGHPPGLVRNPIGGKLGIRGSSTAELVFAGVRVPAANRLGAEGDGLRLAMAVLDRSRPSVAAQALGIAQGALDEAVRYARQRRQFGQAIAEFQAIQFLLADMATGVEAARGLVYLAASRIDAGDPDISGIAAMAKLFASDTAMRVTTDAVQVLGGAGYVRDFPVERMMRDAKITQIYEGTNQIQRLVIARRLLTQAAATGPRPPGRA